MANRYAAEHIIINGKDSIEPWINRYFVPEEEYQQLEAENAQLKAEVNQLNGLLRQAGWGQGEIDSAAHAVETIAHLKEKLAQATAREARLLASLEGIAKIRFLLGNDPKLNPAYEMGDLARRAVEEAGT